MMGDNRHNSQDSDMGLFPKTYCWKTYFLWLSVKRDKFIIKLMEKNVQNNSR